MSCDRGNANVKFSIKGRGRDLNFSDPNAVMQLTKTLLKVDFDLAIELPEDRLCPPVSEIGPFRLQFGETP
jgi:23S rRNA A1618 N6-methylase RlmF